MKQLNDGSTGFYSAFNFKDLLQAGWFFALLGILLTLVFRLTNYLWIIFGAFALFVLYRIFLNKKPYVKITRDTIEIRGFAPIHRNDIIRYYTEARKDMAGRRGITRYYMCFPLKDYSSYKLTLGQKISNKFNGDLPFSVCLCSFPRKERDLFEQAIRDFFTTEK